VTKSSIKTLVGSIKQHVVRVVLAAGVGGIVGLLVTGIQGVTLTQILERVRELPLLAMAAAPALGLLLAALCLRFIAGGAPPQVADAYIGSLHDPDARLDLSPLPGRLFAAIMTIGMGGALGLGGVALYAGAGVGAFAETRIGRFIGDRDTKMLMIAGAAAGIAALFQTPITGVIFALEVPYTKGVGRQNPIPILVASLAGYFVNVGFRGQSYLFDVIGETNLNWRGLLLALAIGLIAGAVAHSFAILLRISRQIACRYPLWIRLLISGTALFGVVILAATFAKDGEILGTGLLAIEWALDPTHAAGAIAGMLILRISATALSLSGDGVGGVFTPLVSAGVLVGRFASGVVGRADETVFAVIGGAAFLGAGYRVPFAAVTFALETTGRPEFIIPAIIAVLAAHLTMGSQSVSEEQRNDLEATW
jgi:chloride channel protein, CIC family